MKVSTCTKRPILEPCGLKDINYQVDPYIGCGHYCYYCYALEKAETDWTKEIRVHEDIVNQLGEELEGISPQRIYIGYHTDPYQPCEAEHLQTRKVLQLLLERGFSAGILTKSDLVLRDIDILGEMECASVSVSTSFIDNNTRRIFEADTMDTEKRIEALYALREVGVRTGSLLCPVIPYITDVMPLLKMLSPCTDVIRIYGLSILDRSSQSWRNVERILRDRFPDIFDDAESAIFSRDHPYWSELRVSLYRIQEQDKSNLDIHL